MGDSQEFCLRWSSYQQQLGEALRSLLDRELLVDVTLACEGRSLRAHRTILSACSDYFQELFQESTHPHPIVILKDVKFEELEALVRFMYHGEVTMNNESLPGFLRTAETLHIRGLTGGSIASKQYPPQPLGKVDVEGVPDSAVASEENHPVEEMEGPGDADGRADGASSPETKRIKLEQVSPVSKSPPKPIQQFSNDPSIGESPGGFPAEPSANRALLKTDEMHSSADLASPREIVANKTLSFEGLSQLVLPVLHDESSSSGQYFMNQGPGIGGNLLPLSQPSANNHGLVSRPFRHRVLWNHDQLLQLETWYRADRYPTGQAMRQYADTLAAMCPTSASPTGASPTRQNVDYWFQNRRRKDSHPEVMQQREKKKLAKTLWGQILDQRGQGTS
ncbi:hypothetical protein R5R35_013519 [Gryllus longicercus]|uniref:Uncharacterized protein n=1 Tax=Gryllus longicercus TaxID=2509291 RepID=A0AAN9Z013_9ORTH